MNNSGGSSSSSSNPQEKHGTDKEEVRFGGSTAFCFKCKNKTITYETDPCAHGQFCTDCARKMATGGRCRVCHEFYGGLRRIRQPGEEGEAGEEGGEK